jgi:hypothetical protein
MALGTQYWDKVIFDMDYANKVGFFSSSFNAFNEAIPIVTTSAKPFRNYGSGVRGIAGSVAPGVTRSPAIAYIDYSHTTYNLGLVCTGLGTVLAGDFTIEAWVYVTNATDLVPIISFKAPAGGNGSFWFFIQNQTLRVHNKAYVEGLAGIDVVGVIPLATFTKVAITRAGNVYSAYINNILVASGSSSQTLVYDANFTTIASSPVNPGFNGTGSVADVLITTAAKTIFDPLDNTYRRYAAQIIGTITESTPITSWTVTGVSATGLSCTTTTTGTTYTLNCPSLEPYTVTCAPTVNDKWTAATTISAGYFVVPSNPNNNPVIYTCTTPGTTSSTEPAFTATTYTDGTVVWTKVGALINPIALGAKIPS